MIGVILAIKLPTLLLLVWAFLRPEETLRPGRRYWCLFAVAAFHVLLALLSFMGKESSLSEMFVAYPLLWAVMLRNPLRRALPPPVPLLVMGVVTCLLLWFEETWVIVDKHSPPLNHYIHYFGFYVGMAATIVLLYSRVRYSVLQTFVVGCLWGVLVEQQFLVPKMLASGAVVQALLFALYIAPVYGLYLAAPRLLFLEEFDRPTRTSRWQGIWLFVAISVVPLATWALWSLILRPTGFDRTGVP